MRRTPTLKMLSIFLSLFLFVFSFQVQASGANRPDLGAEATVAEAPFGETGEMTTEGSAFSHIDPENMISNKAALNKALAYFAQNKSKITNQDYMVLIDYKQHSSKERFYLIDMQTGNVESYNVAHGAGSDPSSSGYASLFSDTNDSHMTSLGFFLTAETYYGSKGYSLKLDGQSSTNASARARAVVIHGADYVNAGSAGRSWGCPALDMRYYDEVIDKIKGGALILSYN